MEEVRPEQRPAAKWRVDLDARGAVHCQSWNWSHVERERHTNWCCLHLLRRHGICSIIRHSFVPAGWSPRLSPLPGVEAKQTEKSRIGRYRRNHSGHSSVHLRLAVSIALLAGGLSGCRLVKCDKDEKRS